MDQDFIPPRSSSRSSLAGETGQYRTDRPQTGPRLAQIPDVTLQHSPARGNSDSATLPLAGRYVAHTFDRAYSNIEPPRDHREFQARSNRPDAQNAAGTVTGYRTSGEAAPGVLARSMLPPPRRSDSSDSSSASRKRNASNVADRTYENKRTSSVAPSRTTTSNAQSRGAGSSAHAAIDLTGPDISPRPSAAPRSFRSTPTLASPARGGIQLPPWQPDNLVSQCPVCGTAFGFLYRKHHCRKCGKVVCDNCSRHRIGLPRQYIVHPPPGVSTSPFSSTFSALGVSASLQVGSSHSQLSRSPHGDSLDGRASGLGMFPPGGAEVVRVCNPCVPDPNLSPPPQTPVSGNDDPPDYLSSAPFTMPARTARVEPPPRQELAAVHDRHSGRASQAPVQIPERRGSGFQGFGSSTNTRPGPAISSGNQWHSNVARIPPPPQPQPPPPRRATLSSQRPLPSIPPPSSQVHRSSFQYPPSDQGIHPERGSSSQIRGSPHPARPPRREIPEEDECPVCGNELPSIGADGNTESREEHVEQCIQIHSFSTSHPAATAPISGSAPTSTSATHEARTASSADLPRRQNANTTAPIGEPQTPPVHTPAEASSSVPTDAAQMVGASQQRPRANRMIVYRASEKDCLGEDGEPQECVICFEEFEPGHEMGRLECWCKFHRLCIRQWWEKKGPGSCPTHQLQL